MYEKGYSISFFLSLSIYRYTYHMWISVLDLDSMVITRLGGEPRVKNATGAPHVNASDEKRRCLAPKVDQFIAPG